MATGAITYVRHAIAAIAAGAVSALAAGIGLALDPETLEAFSTFVSGALVAVTLAVYALVEKFLKRYTGEEEEQEG